MIKVVGVRFRTAGKIYYFDPGKLEIRCGQHVVVETSRGVEYGTVVGCPKLIPEEEVSAPLKAVLRIATKKDDEQVEKNKEKELDPFEDMYEFHRAILSVVPEFYNNAYAISDKTVMCELFNQIFSSKYNMPIEFNTGIGNNSVYSIIKLENDDFLMDSRQLNIQRIWGLLTDDVYDDILLLEIGESLPYVIEDKEHYLIEVIENEYIVPYDAIASGYVRYKGKVRKFTDLDIQERFIGNDYKVIAIAPFHSCTIIDKNDKFLEKLQKVETLKSEDIYDLKEKIHMNRTYDVSMRL